MRRVVALSAFCVGLVGPLAAQDLAEGRLRVVIDTETRLEANDNFALSPDDAEGAIIATQSLGFGLLSETRIETFAFGLGGVYQLGTVPDTGIGTGWRDPSASLSYRREGIRALLDLSALYWRQELGLGRILLEPEDADGVTVLPSDLIDDRGTLDRLAADALLELGRGGPQGLTLGAGYDLRDYSSTTDADLFDRERIDLTSDLRLNLSPSLQMHLLADLSRYEDQDIEATRRDDSQLGLRLDARLDATRRVSARLTQDRIATRETIEGMREESVESGAGGTLSYEQDLTRGAVGVTLGSEFATTGRRNSLTFGRSLELPRALLNLQVGVVGTADGPQGIGEIDYALQLARGTLTASLERSARTTGEDEAILQTVARVAHRTQINTLSGLDFTLDYVSVDGLTDPDDDIARGILSASYNRAVTRDWALSVGVSHTLERDAGVDASSNAVFVSLGRSVTVAW